MIVSGIDDIIKSLIKAVKSIQMYGVKHPSSRNFYDPFYEKLSDYLKKHAELNLEVEQFAILHSGRTVYEEREKDVSIAFRLFRDGIRNLRFTQGLTFDELLSFLATIATVSKDLDIVLRLWECDLAHINFYVVEEEEEQAMDYKVPEVPVVNIDYESKAREIIEKENIDINDVIKPELASGELDYLKTEISFVETKPILPTVITTLISLLKTDQSRDILNSLVVLLERCVDNRDFYNARRIVHHVRENTDIDPMEKFENERTIMGSVSLINTASAKIFNELIAFIGLFSKKSLPYFLNLLSYIERPERLLALRSRIASIAQGDVALMKNFLDTDDTTMLINVIAILNLMKADNIITVLRPLFSHPNPDVRSEIISVLANDLHPAVIAQFLDDESSYVRMKALRALTKMKYSRIYAKLLKKITSGEFRNLELAEQQEYFNCLVTNGAERLTKDLEKILFKWMLFREKKYHVVRKLAATALAFVDSEDALAILRKGLKKRNKHIKSACERALRQT